MGMLVLSGIKEMNRNDLLTILRGEFDKDSNISNESSFLHQSLIDSFRDKNIGNIAKQVEDVYKEISSRFQN